MQLNQSNIVKTMFLSCSVLCLLALIAGCNQEFLRLPSNESKSPKMIGSAASPFGLEPLEVMGYGVIVGLPGTGGNVPQGAARSAALAMLNQQKMEKPSDFLASKDAAVVLVRARIAPGARPQDTFDADIRCLDEDRQTTSLRGGFLLMCSLKDVADVSELSEKGRNSGGDYRAGFEWAIANGPVMISSGKDVDLRKGKVVAGARVKKERPLALLVRNEYNDRAEHAMRISTAIDERFRVQASGSFAKIADAKNGKSITLRVPDQYRHNISRFLDVVCRIPHEAGGSERLYWQRVCAEDLLNPDKCFEAAIRMEALGGDARDQLAKGCQDKNIKIRFASAEALAYLGVASPAAETLAEIVRVSPEMRPYALTALASVDDTTCASQLRELMAADSMETRYGAFVALRTSRPTDLGLKAYAFKEAGYCLYEVAPQAQPMVHLSTTGKPEIVLFGKGHVLQTPFSLTVGPELVVTARDGDPDCTISMTEADGKVVKQRCSCQLKDVLARCTEMGATYADVVDLLRQASNGHNLNNKLIVDGMPRIVPWSELARAEIPVQ